MPERPSIYEQEHEDFRTSVRAFLEKEVVPHHDQWEKDGQVSREVWLKAGEAGLLCFDVDAEHAVLEDFVVLGEAGALGRRTRAARAAAGAASRSSRRSRPAARP